MSDTLPSSIGIADLLIPSDEVIAKLTDEPTNVENTVADLTPTVQDASDLTENTMFLRVSYGNLGNTKKTPGAAILKTDADQSFLRVSKTLLDSPELDAIRHHDNGLRKWLNNVCLPLLDWPGVLVVPNVLVQKVWDQCRLHREERHELVASFIHLYPSLIEKAKTSLGSLYNEMDYPPVEEIKTKFTFYWTIRSFKTPESLKQISAEIWEEEKKATKAQFSAAMEEITAVLRQNLFDLVTHLKDKLETTADGKQKQLRESTVGNLKEFLENFDLRNVTNDTELAEVVTKAKALIGDTDAATIRTSDDFRKKIFEGMDELTVTLGGLVEERPSRKFRLDED